MSDDRNEDRDRDEAREDVVTPDQGRSDQAQERALAREIPEEHMLECPECHQQRPISTFSDGKCSACYTLGKPAGIVASLGWPEVRQRRLILISGSDHTQLSDRSDEVKKRFAEWRQLLRDVTQLPDPFTAWYILDELQQNRPEE